MDNGRIAWMEFPAFDVPPFRHWNRDGEVAKHVFPPRAKAIRLRHRDDEIRFAELPLAGLW
jgi:hypothetical protein